MKKRLTKSRNNRMICGVIGGIGEYFDLDESIITLMRIVYAFMVFAGFGLLLYIIMAIVIPSEDSQRRNTRNNNNYQGYQSYQNSYNSEPKPKKRKMKEAEPVDDKDNDDWSDF